MLLATLLLEYLEGMYLAAHNAALSDGSSAVHFKVRYVLAIFFGALGGLRFSVFCRRSSAFIGG
jgi:hypothetical protein